MEPLNLHGWLPIRIFARQGQWRVDWCWFGDTPLHQPFFREAVDEALRLPFNQAFRRETPLATLSQWQAESPGCEPQAFICHASRCGSTLISQMLAALDHCTVISEPPPLDSLLRSGLPADTLAPALRGLISAYGQARGGVEQRLVIKLDAWHIGELPLLRRCFATTPWLFVYREPLEIAVSHLRRSGMHMVPGLIGPSALDDAESGFEREAFIARRLGRLLQLGLERCVEFQGLAVNYSELPEAMAGRLALFFGLDAEQCARAFSRVEQHAKQPDQVFVADGASKRDEASPLLRERVERWARGPYERLESLRAAQARGRAAGSGF